MGIPARHVDALIRAGPIGIAEARQPLCAPEPIACCRSNARMAFCEASGFQRTPKADNRLGKPVGDLPTNVSPVRLLVEVVGALYAVSVRRVYRSTYMPFLSSAGGRQ